MTLTPAKWTIEEYHSAIESGLLDNRRVELLKGEIVEMSPEGEAHAYFSSEAEEYLRGLQQRSRYNSLWKTHYFTR